MYVYPPPPGVSTGLGYLGNGSGAVMPVEASVSQNTFNFDRAPFLNHEIFGASLSHPSLRHVPSPCQGRVACS